VACASEELRKDILQRPGRNFPSQSLLLFPEAKSAVAGGMGQSPNTKLAAKELSLKQPGPTPSARIGIALVAALALAIPGTAIAQDPSADQYTPTAPSGGGDVPTSPVPNTGDGGPPADTGAGGDSSGAPTTDSGATTPVEPTAATPNEQAAGNGSAGAGKAKSKDDRALDSLAATAAAQRDASSSKGNESPATQLLRSDSGGGLGMGAFLWAVLGVTALWAVAMVVRRRQDQSGHPA
jgi:hypothetical protein